MIRMTRTTSTSSFPVHPLFALRKSCLAAQLHRRRTRSAGGLGATGRREPGVIRTRRISTFEIMQVPLANPAAADVVAARIFHTWSQRRRTPRPRPTQARARGGRGGGRATIEGPQPGPNQCHDITVYPEVGLAGGACGGYGLLLDIRNVAQPRRLDAVADSNFSVLALGYVQQRRDQDPLHG